MKKFVIGCSDEAYNFEVNFQHLIKSATSETHFFLEEKVVYYDLWDGSKVYFIFPFSKIHNK